MSSCTSMFFPFFYFLVYASVYFSAPQEYYIFRLTERRQVHRMFDVEYGNVLGLFDCSLHCSDHLLHLRREITLFVLVEAEAARKMSETTRSKWNYLSAFVSRPERQLENDQASAISIQYFFLQWHRASHSPFLSSVHQEIWYACHQSRDTVEFL